MGLIFKCLLLSVGTRTNDKPDFFRNSTGC